MVWLSCRNPYLSLLRKGALPSEEGSSVLKGPLVILGQEGMERLTSPGDGGEEDSENFKGRLDTSDIYVYHHIRGIDRHQVPFGLPNKAIKPNDQISKPKAITGIKEVLYPHRQGSIFALV